MSPSTVTLYFAYLAVLAELLVVVLLVLAAGSWWSDRGDQRWRRVRAEVGPQAAVLGAVVAGVATAGSLYLSEVAHFDPCRLCWYQRAAMYPLVLILVLAAWRRSARLRALALAFAVVGAGLSTWHVLIERFPSLSSSTSCDASNPCTLVWVEHLGYLTIPTMALSGFLLIAGLLLAGRGSGDDEDGDGDGEGDGDLDEEFWNRAQALND